MDKDFYFSQFEIITSAQMNKNTEICRIKLMLHTKLSPYPKYCACKIFTNPTDQNKNEALMMKEFCTQNHPGLIKYYHHFHLDRLYIFLDNCFVYNSGFEDICLISNTQKNKPNFHPILSKLRYFQAQTINLIKGIQIIHQAGYIHSDIAPKNIFITKELDYKLGDFGSIVRKGGYVVSFTKFYLKPSDYQKNSTGSYLIANESMDFFALGKSLFELLILENQISMNSFLYTMRFKDHVKNTLTQRKLKNSIMFHHIIEQVIDGKIQADEEIQVITTNNPQTTHIDNERSISEKGYCAGCKEVGSLIKLIKTDSGDTLLKYFESSGGSSSGKMFYLRCNHQFHISCFVRKAKENKVLFSFCPECQSFIGVRALKLLTHHPGSKNSLMR